MGVTLTIIMMGIVLGYLVWPKIVDAQQRFAEIVEETERDRGEIDSVIAGAVAGSTLFAAVLAWLVAIAYAA